VRLPRPCGRPATWCCCLLLASCGTHPLQGGPHERPSSPSPGQDQAAAAPSIARLIAIARQEWEFFGGQRVVLEGDEESIPHVGAWEDEDDLRSERIRGYWQAAGEPDLSGRDCEQAWSAAFLVWLMRSAGVAESEFPTVVSHRAYLAKFLAETGPALFVPHPIAEYRPRPGDLICAIRENGVQTAADELPRPAELANAKLHCDLVTAVEGTRLQAIGGNVRNSVSLTRLALSPAGLLQPAARRRWFLILENRMASVPR